MPSSTKAAINMRVVFYLVFSSWVILCTSLWMDSHWTTIWVGLALVVLLAGFVVALFPKGENLRISPNLFSVLLTFNLVYFLILLVIRLPAIYLRNNADLNIFYFLILVSLVLAPFAWVFRYQSKIIYALSGVFLFIFIAASYWVLESSPAPIIDVWTVIQGATEAFLEGKNPYALRFPKPPALFNVIHDDRFVYLPLNFILSAPFFKFFGDIRYANLACLIAAGILLFLIARATAKSSYLAFLLTALFWFHPRGFFFLEQAWTETLIPVFVFASVLFFLKKRNALGGVFVGLALASKQFMLPLAPLYVRFFPNRWKVWGISASVFLISIVPFIIWSPQDFFDKVIGFHLNRPMRLDSISLNTLLHIHFFRSIPTWTPFLMMIGTITIGLKIRKQFGFALTSATAYFLFFYFNKIAFLNYYYLVGTFLILTLALLPVEKENSTAISHPNQDRDRPEKKSNDPSLKIYFFKIAYLILLNFFVLNVLFLFRYSPKEAIEIAPKSRHTIFERIRLYFSLPHDLRTYYRYANRTLGFPEDDEFRDIMLSERLIGENIINRTESFSAKKQTFRARTDLSMTMAVLKFRVSLHSLILFPTSPLPKRGFNLWGEFQEYGIWSSDFSGIPERNDFPNSFNISDKQNFRSSGSRWNLASLGQFILGDTKVPVQAQMPYRDFIVEYPPLSLAPILYARMLSDDFETFAKVFSVLVSLFAYGSLILAYLILKKLPHSQVLSLSELLLFSFFSLLAIGTVFPSRLDIFAAFFTIASIWALLGSRFVLCSLFLALGVSAKLFPFIFVPLVAITLIAKKDWKNFVLSGIAFLLALSAIHIPIWHFSEGRYLDSYLYHFSRPIEIESLFANLMFLQSFFGQIPSKVLLSFESLNIVSMTQGSFLFLSKYLPILFFVSLYLLYFHLLKKTQEPLKRNALQVKFYALLILAFLITCKVFSPQFLIWLFPLIFLVPSKKKYLLSFLYIGVCFLAQLIYPKFFVALQNYNPLAVAILTLKNMGILTIFFLILSEILPLSRKNSPGPNQNTSIAVSGN